MGDVTAFTGEVRRMMIDGEIVAAAWAALSTT